MTRHLVFCGEGYLSIFFHNDDKDRGISCEQTRPFAAQEMPADTLW